MVNMARTMEKPFCHAMGGKKELQFFRKKKSFFFGLGSLGKTGVGTALIVLKDSAGFSEACNGRVDQSSDAFNGETPEDLAGGGGGGRRNPIRARRLISKLLFLFLQIFCIRQDILLAAL